MSLSIDRKRARREDVEVDRREKPREKLSRTDLICPICFDVFREVHVTTCGHSFCHDCIKKCLTQSSECPVCKTALPPNSVRFVPNFALNDVIARVKNEEKGHVPNVKPEVKELLAQSSKLDQEDYDEFVKEIEARKKVFDQERTDVSWDVYQEFLKESKKRTEIQFERMKSRIDHLNKKLEDANTHGSKGDLSLTAASMKASRLMHLHANFGDVEEGYFSAIQPPEAVVEVDAEPPVPFREQLNNITQYSKFTDLATLFYGDLPATSGSSIVSSIEFDKDGDFFAVGGVTRKIKIYEYNMVALQQPKFNSLHYPVLEIPCQAKLSSVCFNPYLKHQLAASDYDGTLSIWDTQYQRCTHTFQEHEKRVWSVSYNSYDPGLIATGGDDCSLKLWHLNKNHSVRSQPTRANVCSVRFQPGNSKYNLAYGSADHMIRLVDIRKFNEPYLTLKGHRKAVSYVQYLNDKELVSASTDSELKLWSTETGHCIKTFRGHVNEKNFVGLTVNDEFISCGSENNSFCVYHKFVSQPILKYKFDIPTSVLPGTQEHRDEGNDFVSSVCFRKDSRTILAANSLGYIKVLEMS